MNELSVGNLEMVQLQQKKNVNLNELEWLTSEEAAQYLRKSRNAVLLLVSRGKLRARKFMRRLYFRRVELDRLLETSTA